MAKLTIEIEENEFALYDYKVFENGELILADNNFTRDDLAEDYARGNYMMWQLGLESDHEVSDD